MKVRDISLMAAGAIVSVAAITLASAFFNPPRAQAQGVAVAPGAVAIGVTANPAIAALNAGSQAGVATCGGVITIHDSASRTVKVVAYVNTINNNSGTALTVPTILLSTNASFTY